MVVGFNVPPTSAEKSHACPGDIGNALGVVATDIAITLFKGAPTGFRPLTPAWGAESGVAKLVSLLDRVGDLLHIFNCEASLEISSTSLLRSSLRSRVLDREADGEIEVPNTSSRPCPVFMPKRAISRRPRRFSHIARISGEGARKCGTIGERASREHAEGGS